MAYYRNPYGFLLFCELARQDMPAYRATMEDWFELIGRHRRQRRPSGLAGGRRSGDDREAMATAARRQDVRDSHEQYFRAHVPARAGDWQGALDQFERTPKRQAFYSSIDPAFDAARRDSDFLQAIAELGFPVVPARELQASASRVKASGPAAARLAATRDIDGLSKVTSATPSAMLTAVRDLHQSQEENTLLAKQPQHLLHVVIGL